MTGDFWATLYVFVLASFIGLGVIRRVSRLLHTPLMSLTNAISAIAIVGAILVTGGDHPLRIRMLGAIALVVSYFSGPMLNFGDFYRYGKSFQAVRTGNLLGLPVNFLVFSLLVVITASLTVPVYGELITDPVATVARIDSTFAIVLGALTFTVATIGINIVANFISPAFDFSNVSPQRISWRAGGMIAAVGSVLVIAVAIDAQWRRWA